MVHIKDSEACLNYEQNLETEEKESVFSDADFLTELEPFESDIHFFIEAIEEKIKRYDPEITKEQDYINGLARISDKIKEAQSELLSLKSNYNTNGK